jgi:NADPH2:quinone reductase
MFAIQVDRMGGPEVLEWQRVATPVPGPGELLVEIAAAGVNYVETYHRRGIYKRELPFVIGAEGAGRVVEVGPGVEGFDIGDLVASVGFRGSYAERAVVDAADAVLVPDHVDPNTAAATLLQGLTAHYLVHDSYAIQPGEMCLIHAGAGGVGRLLIQMAKKRGAFVFTTVSTDEKAELAAGAGADRVIRYLDEDFARVIEAEAGTRPLATVYDGVGASTFDKGLTLIRPTGTMVLFGQSSGVVPPFDLGRLATEGSLYVTRPTLSHFIADREALERRSADVLGWMADGSLEIRIGHRYPLSEARRAHEDLEARRTTGKLLLIPGPFD